FRSGKLGIMDYYKFENIQADTRMRDSIAHPGETHPKKGNPKDDQKK
ncbi:MAG: flotillin-like FloA family protein, partial [Bacteroidales bacterium]|nr:flotillin-like FloA family protein [Bacteroidales bacterium]